MSDILIQHAGDQHTNVRIIPPPSHLISLEGKKTDRLFIALKLDKLHNHIDATGFYLKDGSSDDAAREKAAEIIQTAIKERSTDIVEVSIPWRKINSITSLVYRHKGSK